MGARVGVSTASVATGSWATWASTVAFTFGVGSAEGTSTLEQASMRIPMSTDRTTVIFISKTSGLPAIDVSQTQ